MRFLPKPKGHLLAVLMAASELKLSHLQGNMIHLDSLPALLPRSTLLHYPLMPMLNMQGPLPKSLLRESFRKQIFFPSCDLISPKNMDFISVEILLLGKISFQVSGNRRSGIVHAHLGNRVITKKNLVLKGGCKKKRCQGKISSIADGVW